MPTNKSLLGSYDAANQFLGNRESKHWPSIRYTTIERTIGGDFRGYGYKSEYRANPLPAIAVRYHSTNVVTYFQDGRIELNSGGYDDSVTTKRRINHFCANSEAQIRIYQEKFNWYVRTSKGTFEFKDHMVILPDGNVEGERTKAVQDFADNINLFFTALATYITIQGVNSNG